MSVSPKLVAFWDKRLSQTEERFKSKYYVNDNGCWVWTGVYRQGYGYFRVGSTRDGTRSYPKAATFSYKLYVGEIPKCLELDHLCMNRACVNPAHLEPVTHTENIQRAYRVYGPENWGNNREKAIATWAKPEFRARYAKAIEVAREKGRIGVIAASIDIDLVTRMRNEGATWDTIQKAHPIIEAYGKLVHPSISYLQQIWTRRK